MTISDRLITISPLGETLLQPGVSSQLGEKIKALGHQRAFVVCDPGVAAAGLLEPITAQLSADGIEYQTFTEVEPNPTDRNVDAGVAALKDFGEAVVVLVGGGSAMDLGKYVAIATPNDGGGVEFAFAPELDDNDMIDMATLVPPSIPMVDPYPTIAIPTTSGTASETNGGGLITDTANDRKLTFNHDGVLPKVVLLDPALTVGLPPTPTATCGMDALTHSIEAFTSVANHPYADALALEAIHTVGEWLPRVMDDPSDIEGRTQLMLAAHMAGRAFSSGPLLGLVHATGHPVSAVLHQPHGQTLATMLPHVMAFNLDAAADRYARVAGALGAAEPGADDATNANTAIEAVSALSDRVGTAKSLSDLGASSDHVPGLVQQALSDLIIMTTPRYPNRADVTELYHAAL